MVKLVDYLGTKYVYKTFYTPLVKLIRDNPDETIDLAGACITKDCMTAITSLGIGAYCCHFIDSEDPARDALLKYNQEQALINKPFRDKTAKLQGLPIPDCKEDIIKYLNKDYGDIYWQLAVQTRSARLWCALLQARRPDVKLYTMGQLKELLDIVCEFYRSHWNVGKPVIFLGEGNSLCHHDCATVELCDSHSCVSDKFGRVNLFNEPDWEKPLHNMVLAFKRSITPQTQHIKDYL